MENCSLLKINTDKSRKKVTSLTTSHGEVECDYFVNAAGQVSVKVNFERRQLHCY